jgi:hypothetical protein
METQLEVFVISFTLSTQPIGIAQVDTGSLLLKDTRSEPISQSCLSFKLSTKIELPIGGIFVGLSKKLDACRIQNASELSSSLLKRQISTRIEVLSTSEFTTNPRLKNCRQTLLHTAQYPKTI